MECLISLVCLSFFSVCQRGKGSPPDSTKELMEGKQPLLIDDQPFVDGQDQRFFLTTASIALEKASLKEAHKIEAVVNAANPALQGGGGIDGAIHRAAGPKLKAACIEQLKKRGQQQLGIGEALVTESFDLKDKSDIKYIIHTVGPRCDQNNQHLLLYNAYYNSMKVIDQHNQHHPQSRAEIIGFPMISVGIYKVPADLVANAAIPAVRQGFKDFSSIKRVILFGGTNQDPKNQARFDSFVQRSKCV